MFVGFHVGQLHFKPSNTSNRLTEFNFLPSKECEETANTSNSLTKFNFLPGKECEEL